MSNLSNKKSVIIYGNGAMARVYASYLSRQFKLRAFTVEQSCCNSRSFMGLDLVPFEGIEQVYSTKDHAVIVAVGYLQMNQLRANISQKAKQKGYSLEQFIAPDLWQNDDVSVGENSVVLDKCSIHCGSVIGSNVFIASGVNIGHDCTIENNTWVNSGVSLAGGVTVGEGCFLGVNACVAHGVILAPGTFVGANTLVTKNTDLNQVVVSNPGEVYPINSGDYQRFLEANHAV